MVAPATVTDCPAAVTAEECVLDATGRPVTVDAEHGDSFAVGLVTLGNNPGTAANSANVLSMLRSRRQGLGLRRIA